MVVSAERRHWIGRLRLAPMHGESRGVASSEFVDVLEQRHDRCLASRS